jgi:hypothetical protein
MNKKTRRFLRRVSDRKNSSFLESIENFYKEDLNKNHIFSFYKKRRKGYGRKYMLNKHEKNERDKSKHKMLDLIRKTSIIKK